MFVSLLLSMFVCFRRCVNLNKQLNTLACREGGNDVGALVHSESFNKSLLCLQGSQAGRNEGATGTTQPPLVFP